MNDKTWLNNVANAAKVYNEGRLHRDFQSDEVLKFVQWLHRQYGYVYNKPEPTSKTFDNK